MKQVTVTELRGNIYKVLDDVLVTGIPIEIKKNGKLLRITPIEKCDKFSKLVSRPDFIDGDPEALIEINWEGEINLDLP